MVGFIDNSSIKVKEEEKKEAVQSVEDWMEGNSELFITDIKEDSGRIGTEKFDLEVAEKSFEMGVEDICKPTIAEDGFGCLIEEELGKVSLKGVLDESVEIGANRGNGISEGVADIEKDVKSEQCEMENGVDGYKRSDEIVGIEGTKVKSSEIGIVECGSEKNDEIVGIEGGGIKSSEVSGFDGNRRVSGNTLTVDSDGVKGSEKMSDGEKSDSESESGTSCSASSSASSSSSSSSSDEDDDEDEVEEKEEGEMDVEEGEIRDSFGEEMVAWSDEDEEFGSTKAGPIMSVNEIKVLPPVPPVGVTLQPCHETLPVGVVLSTVGAQVVVEGVEKHNPLNEGSILWITEKRSPLGIVDEIFGPVKNPYYIVRYNSDSEVPAGIQQGTLISFVPEFVNHVLNNGNLYKKGYDASGENDEELSDIVEFSDDEKEAEYKRMQKMSKRGPKDQAVENRRKNKNKSKRRGGPWEGDQHSLATTPNERAGQVPSNQNHYFPPPSSNERASQVPSNQSHHFPPSSNERVSQAPSNQNHHFAPPSSNERASQVPSNQNHHFPPPSSLDRGNCSNPLPPFQAFSGGPGLVPVFPQVAQVPGFVAPSSGVWMNGIPCQPPQSVGFSNVPTPNNIMQLQQNHSQQPYQMPPFNGMPLQQQFSGQMFPSNFVLPGGQPGFGAGATFTPMNPMMIGQNNFSQFQAAMSQNNFCQAAINMQGQHAINMQSQHVINLSQSQAAVGMQGQHAPPSLNNGEQGVSSTECGSEQNCSSQPLSASPAGIGGSQNFSSGVNFGWERNSYRRGGGRFGGGRGRRQSR